MKRRSPGIFLLLCFIQVMQHASAQVDDSPVAAWWLPGISWQASKKISLLGEPGYSRYYRAGIGYLQGFITVNKNIVLNPAYLYFLNETPGQEWRQEHFLMNAVIGRLPMGKFLLDDRNMLWNRLSARAEPQHIYRNRLRLVRSFQPGGAQLKVYGYGEVFYSFDNNEWMRNRLAIGASYDIFRKANIDITYIRQWDRAGGWLHLFFIMGTWKL